MGEKECFEKIHDGWIETSPPGRSLVKLYLSVATIASLLPIHIRGSQSLEELKSCCHECRKKLYDKDFRGHIQRTDDILFIRGISFCHSCKTVMKVSLVIDTSDHGVIYPESQVVH